MLLNLTQIAIILVYTCHTVALHCLQLYDIASWAPFPMSTYYGAEGRAWESPSKEMTNTNTQDRCFHRKGSERRASALTGTHKCKLQSFLFVSVKFAYKQRFQNLIQSVILINDRITQFIRLQILCIVYLIRSYVYTHSIEAGIA